jgi:hypothetical protein
MGIGNKKEHIVFDKYSISTALLGRFLIASLLYDLLFAYISRK